VEQCKFPFWMIPDGQYKRKMLINKNLITEMPFLCSRGLWWKTFQLSECELDFNQKASRFTLSPTAAASGNWLWKTFSCGGSGKNFAAADFHPSSMEMEANDFYRRVQAALLFSVTTATTKGKQRKIRWKMKMLSYFNGISEDNATSPTDTESLFSNVRYGLARRNNASSWKV